MTPLQSSLASEFFGFLKTPGFRKYFPNTSWMMVERIIQMGVAFVVGAYVARYLGPKNLGVLAYATCFAGFFFAFASLGLESIVIRELVDKPGDRDRILGTAFWMKFSGALSVVGILAALMLVLRDDSSILILIIATGILFQSFYVIDFN